MSSSNSPQPKGMARIIGTNQRRLEFDLAVKEIVRQRKVMSTMQNVAREQKKDMKRLEKMERKMEKKQSSEALAEKNAKKRQMLREAQMENLKTLESLREELKPHDFRKASPPDRSNSAEEGGRRRFKSLATSLIVMKKIETAGLGNGKRPGGDKSLDMGEHAEKGLKKGEEELEITSRSVRSSDGSKDDKGEQDPKDAKTFSATLAGMKLASATTDHTVGKDGFTALATLKLNETASGKNWHKNVIGEGDDEDENNGLDVSLNEYASQPVPLIFGRTSSLEINVEELMPTKKGVRLDDFVSNGIRLQELVPTSRRSVGESKTDALWMEDTVKQLNYDEDENSSESVHEEDGNERLESPSEEVKVNETPKPLNDINPFELDFHPTPLPLNPLREDSEASLDCMVPPSSHALHHSDEKNIGQIFERRNHLLKHQGKTPSGHTNQTQSTNTMMSSNDSEGASVSSLHKKKDSKMARLKNSLRSSFRGSSGSDNAVSELNPGGRCDGSSSHSVGTSASSKWRMRLLGRTSGEKCTEKVPPEFVEAKPSIDGDRRQQMKHVNYVSDSMVSALSCHSSSRSLKSSVKSVSSRFGEFFDDHSHVQAVSDALSVHSNGTQQSSVKSYYRFPTHEHPLIRIRPIELFPNSPGWQCDYCSMETTVMTTMAYVSTEQNVIVCRQCFASVGSKVEK